MVGMHGDDEKDREDVTNALKSVRYVFARLEHDNFSLFNDLYMKSKLTSFKRSDIQFVDQGTCL